MSKLLYIFERDMPTVSITRDVMTNIKKFPEIKSDFVYLNDVTSHDIDSHDIIIFIRPDNNYAWKIADEARKAGHIIITFCDDDLLNLPISFPTIPWRKKGLIKTLEYSDIIWSSSRYIANKYRDLTRGKRSAISDTIIDPDDLNDKKIIRNKREDHVVKIVYAAAPSHSGLFEQYITPIIPRLSEKYGSKISFTFVSVHPEVNGIDCEYVPGMPLLKYRNYMKAHNFDIGVAPLLDDEFSKCKYFNKFLEYTTQGIVGIYSNTEPYTYVIENKKNGLLADNTLESWYTTLCTAIDDEALRRECLKNAVNFIRTKHSEEACITKTLQDIPELLQSKSCFLKCKNFRFYMIRYYLTRPLDWMYLLFFYYKKIGFRAVLKRIKQHFSEVKAYSRRKE